MTFAVDLLPDAYRYRLSRFDPSIILGLIFLGFLVFSGFLYWYMQTLLQQEKMKQARVNESMSHISQVAKEAQSKDELARQAEPSSEWKSQYDALEKAFLTHLSSKDAVCLKEFSLNSQGITLQGESRMVTDVLAYRDSLQQYFATSSVRKISQLKKTSLYRYVIRLVR